MISSDKLQEIKAYACVINFPEGFVYKVWPVGDSVRFFMYRDNMLAMNEKELVDISNKVGKVMAFTEGLGVRGYVEVRSHVPKP